jgi:drug/metabolite transporter (DMT)-like permease
MLSVSDGSDPVPGSEKGRKMSDSAKHSSGRIWIGVALMFVCAACLCAGQLIWKMYDGFGPLVAGFLLYLVGSAAMICAYHFGSVSILQPINSVSYIFSTILGAVILHESVTPLKIAAVFTILVGVFILAAGGSKDGAAGGESNGEAGSESGSESGNGRTTAEKGGRHDR